MRTCACRLCQKVGKGTSNTMGNGGRRSNSKTNGTAEKTVASEPWRAVLGVCDDTLTNEMVILDVRDGVCL